MRLVVREVGVVALGDVPPLAAHPLGLLHPEGLAQPVDAPEAATAAAAAAVFLFWRLIQLELTVPARPLELSLWPVVVPVVVAILLSLHVCQPLPELPLELQAVATHLPPADIRRRRLATPGQEDEQQRRARQDGGSHGGGANRDETGAAKLQRLSVGGETVL